VREAAEAAMAGSAVDGVVMDSVATDWVAGWAGEGWVAEGSAEAEPGQAAAKGVVMIEELKKTTEER